MRLFAALPLPDIIIQQLLLLKGGIEGARWQRTDQFHLSLRFIGEVDRNTAEDIEAALAGIYFEPFEVGLRELGLFGNRKRPRVLWVGVEDQPPLLRLHNKIDQALLSVGIPPEERRYSPHVTLARMKNASGKQLNRYLESMPEPSLPPFGVDTFNLYQSHLNNDGASYEVLQSYAADQTPNRARMAST